MLNCIFCKIGSLEIPAKFILKKENCFVIQDISPQAVTHLLIIPFAHVVDMGDPSIQKINFYGLAKDLFDSCQELKQMLSDDQSFKIQINNGEASGQKVFHLHWHFLSKDKINILRNR